MHLFRKYLKDFSTSPEVCNYYGELLLDQQQYEEAVTHFDKSIELDKNTYVPLPPTLRTVANAIPTLASLATSSP